MSNDLERRLRDQGATAAAVAVSPERVWRAVGRRRRVRLAAASATATAAVVAVAVGANGQLSTGQEPVVAGGVSEHRGVTLALEPGELKATDIAAAQTEFGVDLLHTLCASSPGENLLVSPTSAAQALGMLQPAADGQDAVDIAEALHLPEWSPELVAALREHTVALQRLAAPDNPDEDADRVRVSNRVWADSSIDPTQDYLDGVATGYAAGLPVIDVSADPRGATDLINETVSEETDGLVPELLEEPLNPDTVAVLTNAIHLDATWETEFDGVTTEPFATADGAIDVEMMRDGEGTLRTVDGWTSVEIPYTDGTLSAVALLPPEHAEPCEVTSADLAAATRGEGSTTTVWMPRLRLEQTHELLEPFAQLGVPLRGDYPGLGAGRPLEIERAVQKTFLEADEEGTVAAAATAVEMVPLSAGGGPVVVDRSFVLLLTDTETHSPLFLGVVHDPTAS